MEGCLYLGNNDLNQPNILKNLQDKLKPVIDRIGTIQISHHGALKNFKCDLLGVFHSCRSCFMSFANNNTYGHPSLRVIAELLAHGCEVYQITGARDSAYIQVIHRYLLN